MHMGEATLAHPSAMAPGKNEKLSVDPLVFPLTCTTQDHTGALDGTQVLVALASSLYMRENIMFNTRAFDQCLFIFIQVDFVMGILSRLINKQVC
jgi:hypothetical protein